MGEDEKNECHENGRFFNKFFAIYFCDSYLSIGSSNNRQMESLQTIANAYNINQIEVMEECILKHFTMIHQVKSWIRTTT